MESRNPEREARQAAAMRDALRKMDEEDAKKALTRPNNPAFTVKKVAPAPEPKPAIPAGWYPHPSMAATQRYWDGEEWTDNIAPMSAIQSAPVKSAGMGLLDRPLVRFAGVAILLLVLFGAIKIPSWLSGYEADIGKIESEIERGIRQQSDLTAQVECPNSIDWEVGRTFHCIATASDGSRASVEVTMENDEGDLSWRVE